MKIVSALSRSLALTALCLLVDSAQAQNCSGSISATVTQVSISTGGVQPLDLTVAPSEIDLGWQVLGALGMDQPVPFLANGGLLLNNDRYLFHMYTGHAGFVQGGIGGLLGGLRVPFDAAGHAQLSVVVPPGLPSSLIGRTLHHGMYRTNPLDLLPICGTPTARLLLLP